MLSLFFFQAEDGIRDIGVTGVQTCALPIFHPNIFWPSSPIKGIMLKKPIKPLNLTPTNRIGLAESIAASIRYTHRKPVPIAKLVRGPINETLPLRPRLRLPLIMTAPGAMNLKGKKGRAETAVTTAP